MSEASAIGETHFLHPKTGASVAYGPSAICTTIASILEEVRRARGMFPGANHNFAALIEEVGELAKALLDHSFGKADSGAVYSEAVQVAAMAIRVLEEGSAEFPYPDIPRRTVLLGEGVSVGAQQGGGTVSVIIRFADGGEAFAELSIAEAAGLAQGIREAAGKADPSPQAEARS